MFRLQKFANPRRRDAAFGWLRLLIVFSMVIGYLSPLADPLQGYLPATLAAGSRVAAAAELPVQAQTAIENRALAAPAAVETATQNPASAPLGASLLPGWAASIGESSAATNPSAAGSPALGTAALPDWYAAAPSGNETTAALQPAARLLAAGSCTNANQLALSLTVPAEVSLGNTTGDLFTVTATNSGATTTTEARLLVTPSAGFYFVAGSATASDGSPITPLTISPANPAPGQAFTIILNHATANRNNLQPAETITFNFRLATNGNAQSGQLLTTALRSGSPTAVTCKTAQENIQVVRGNLIVTKSPALQTATFGKVVTWTVTLENTGQGALYNAILTDTIGSGYTGFSITPTPAPVNLAAGASFSYIAQATVNSCNALDNQARAAWFIGNADGTGTAANPVDELADVILQITDPDIAVNIGPIPTISYCGALNATVPVTVSNVGGAARNVFLTLASVLPAGATVSVNPAFAATWSQSGNTITYVPGTIPTGGSVVFNLDIATGNLCSTASLAVTLTPTYEDSCLLLQASGTPDTETVLLPVAAPSLVVTKDGPTTMVAGQSYQYIVTVSGDNRQGIGAGGIAITDVVPSNLIINSVTSSGGTPVVQNANTLRWNKNTSGSGSFSEQFFINVTVPSQGAGACGAGTALTNQVLAVADIACPQCQLSASATRPSFVYDFLNPALNTFTKEASPIELCGPPTANVITATLQVGSGITWTNTIYTDTLGAGSLAQSFTVVPGSVQVRVDGVDRTANVAISEGPPLVINFGGLSGVLGAFSPTATIVIVYQIDG